MAIRGQQQSQLLELNPVGSSQTLVVIHAVHIELPEPGTQPVHDQIDLLKPLQPIIKVKGRDLTFNDRID